jgi:hypothetical protein
MRWENNNKMGIRRTDYERRRRRIEVAQNLFLWFWSSGSEPLSSA